MSAILTVEGLGLSARDPLVTDVSFRLDRGEALGLVGESGSGKSLTLRAILGILPRGVRRTAGEIATGGPVGMVFQDPLSALDPLMAVGRQLEEVCRTTGGLGRRAARARALELLALVRLPDPESRWAFFPHQLSGGQRQRVVIAIALATNPAVLLCDEPTTALDVTVQAEILGLLDALRTELGLAVVFVSHDLAVVGTVCSSVIVMSHGRVVERGEMASLVRRPAHPYTRMLVDAILPVPVLHDRPRGTTTEPRSDRGATR